MVSDFQPKSTSETIDKIKTETFNKNVGSASSFLPTPPNHTSSQIFNRPIFNCKDKNYPKKSPIIVQPDIAILDQSATKLIINRSTVKYSLILLITIMLSTFLVFIFIVGAMNIQNCRLNPKIPIYLLVVGLMGFLRLLLFYSCPFSYSKSTAGNILKVIIPF